MKTLQVKDQACHRLGKSLRILSGIWCYNYISFGSSALVFVAIVMISTRILRSEDASLGTMGIIQNTVFGSKEQRYFELKPIL